MDRKEKLDYKKVYKDLYLPKMIPAVVQVPSMNFIMVDGSGQPGEQEYKNAMQCLYSFSFTIKMSKMSGSQPPGYFEYVVPPLEGLWSCTDGPFDFNKRDQWLWTSLIRQPEFVTADVVQSARRDIAAKKPELDISRVKFESLEEGLCVQAMHRGPYAEEERTIQLIYQYIEENGYQLDWESGRRHHEIYLSDPRRCKPDNLKTVIRYPVKQV